MNMSPTLSMYVLCNFKHRIEPSVNVGKGIISFAVINKMGKGSLKFLGAP